MADFSYDLATTVGKIRLLIFDKDEASYIFTDGELTEFYSLEDSSIFCAAALALESIASNEAYVQKRIKILDITTDGPAVAKALLERAKILREKAAEADWDIDWAEMAVSDFAYREMVEKERL
jgi:hypothetical protein